MADFTPNQSEGHARGQPIVIPLLLIGLGVLLLLNNLGYVPGQVWSTIWQFWPLALVLLGVEILINRRVPWAILILAIILVIIAGMSGWFGRGPARRAASVPPAAAASHQELGAASRAMLTLHLGAGDVHMYPFDSATDLAQWAVEGDEGRLNRSYQVREGLGRLELMFRGGRWFAPFQRDDDGRTSLSLGVRRGVPLELDAKLGASSADLDLTELNVTDLELDAGASQGTISFPANVSSRAIIRGGASNLTLVIPEGVGARIVSSGGMSSVRVDPSRFTTVNQDVTTAEYRSADYEAAPNKLDLTLNLGAASVEIR